MHVIDNDVEGVRSGEERSGDETISFQTVKPSSGRRETCYLSLALERHHSERNCPLPSGANGGELLRKTGTTTVVGCVTVAE